MEEDGEWTDVRVRQRDVRQPAGAAPSVVFWRRVPTRIFTVYSLEVEPNPPPTPIQTSQNRVEPNQVEPNTPTKHTVRESYGIIFSE